MVLKSQLPHWIVNWSFTIRLLYKKLTVLWGGSLSKTIWLIHCVRWDLMWPNTVYHACGRRIRNPCTILISQKVFIRSFCKRQFPHKSVNLSFIITNVTNKLTDLCGEWLLKNDFGKRFSIRKPCTIHVCFVDVLQKKQTPDCGDPVSRKDFISQNVLIEWF